MQQWRKKQETEKDKGMRAILMVSKKAHIAMKWCEEIKSVAPWIVEVFLAEGIS